MTPVPDKGILSAGFLVTVLPPVRLMSAGRTEQWFLLKWRMLAGLRANNESVRQYDP